MMSTSMTDRLKSVSEKDRKQIRDAEEMLGPDPSKMGFIKNLFWGNFKQNEVIPYPERDPEETARCDQLLAALDEYLRNEHPAFEIDEKQEIPQWVIDKLFKLGVMGMIIPQKYGGGGFSITSYNRVLSRIGESCGSTAVMVSAHQSIGCGAINLFGTEEQKRNYLPRMASDMLSAFCLSEPNVGCDAGGQEAHCELTEDGEHYILNGEKKWATSAAMSGLFTVMAKQKITNADTGKVKEKITALICTPDMAGIDIFSRNRAKCGIRGTWQARIRFTNVKVPKENLLHQEGRGLNVALTCLNYGRCTLSAGMVGGGKAAYEQAVKWAQYRYQFQRPIAEFDLIKEKLAKMAAYVHAMDAMLYMTTGIVDRNDEDIMLETAVCKVFCSEYGFRTVDNALQVMGGEGYMTENTVERLWRDSRINIIVEGANEVMHSFIFAYGSKQLGEYMLNVKEKPLKHMGAALKIGAQLFLGIKPRAPRITSVHGKMERFARRLEKHTQQLSHEVKMSFKRLDEKIVTAQLVQERLSMAVIWIHAMTCSMSKVDMMLKKGVNGTDIRQEITLLDHVFALGEQEITAAFAALRENPDDTVQAASDVALDRMASLPNSDFVIPERTMDMDARGKGAQPDQTHIPQFGSGSLFKSKDATTV